MSSSNWRAFELGDGLDARVTGTSRSDWTSFSSRLRRGPWPESVVQRLEGALEDLTRVSRRLEEIDGVVLFGSFTRGEYGRKSDVDLLVLLDVAGVPEASVPGQAMLQSIGGLESAWQLPMHLSPLLASTQRPHELGPDLLHALGRDGIILYGRTPALALLQPAGLVPWTVVRFSLTPLAPSRRAVVSRRLRGGAGRRGLIQPPGLFLGPGPSSSRPSKSNR